VDEQAEAQDDIRAIDGLLTAFGDAVVAGKVSRIRSMLCQDTVSIFTGTTGRVRGAEEIASVWAEHVAAWSDVSLERSDTLVRIHGDTAWATFTWTGSGRADGEQYVVNGERWSVVLLWEEGEWRFAQTHSSFPFTDWASLKHEGVV
tara:strand:- start:220 stop:660 length:441 start_codon:yes stop_codon:yes gene_type:complete